MDALPEALQKKYAALKENRALLEAMKLEQGLRGEEKHLERRAHRAATHTSWRQMGGARLFLHEINHPGNKPFAIGFGITSAMFLWVYLKAYSSDEMKKESGYWSRYMLKNGGAGGHH